MATGKYAIPEVSDIVERKRLFSFFDKNSRKNVFLILGQAAQGKSTLIASYLSLSVDQTLWLHLDKSKSDHTMLFDIMINAFSQSIGNNEYFKSLIIPQTTLGIGEGTARHSEVLITLFNSIEQKINIVMDDLESLDENASSFSLIQNIIKNIPSNISIFLLSRQMPFLAIEKMKMEKKIAILNNEDIAFTFDETEMFFKEIKKTKNIDLPQIKKIHEATEGWAGGLTLVLESIRHSSDLTKLPDHIAQNAFSFFSEEIYSPLPDQTKDFLMKTSLFEVIDPEILNAFCEDDPDPVQILKELAKRNLFIQKVDSSGKWPAYRYNKVFKNFLKRALLENINSDEFKKLNIEVGMIFQEKKEYEQALQYFIEAQAYQHIGKIVKIIGTDFVIKDRVADLGNWMKIIPNEMIWKDPWLIFYLTMTRRIKGGEQNINDFKIALSIFEKTNDIRSSILCIAYLIEASVFMRKPFHIILNWIIKGKDLLKSIETPTWFVWARALLWQQTGFGYIAGNGDILKGISACQNAAVLAGKIGNPALKLNASIVMILGYVQGGDFTNAEIILSKIEGLTKEVIHPEYRVLKNLVNIDYAMKKGDFVLSKKLLLKAENDIEKFGFLFLYPGLIEAKAMYYIYTQNHKDADTTSEHLSDFSILEGNDFYKGIAHGIKAVNLYHQAKYKAAEKEALKAFKIMENTKRSNIHLFWVKQILGFILLHLKKFKQAEKELQLCFDYCKQISSDLCLTEASLALGLLKWEQSETDQAFKYIETGLKKAVKENYVHFNIMSLNDFTRSLLIMQVCKGSLEEITPLLTSEILKYVPLEIDSVFAGKAKKDKAKGLVRLKEIHKYVLPKLKIETLGGFRIFKDNQIIENINWEGARPKLLLKAVVSHGGKEIPKEVLIEDIWPESNTKSGEKNFKINLHRLRKALEPDVDQMFGYSYLIHKAGLISFDTDLVSIDIDDFLQFCLKGEAEEKKNKIEKAVSLYDKAIGLYKGDYFIEEPYVEWLLARRDLFRMKYIETLQKKALLHSRLRQFDTAKETWQKILQADPLFEKAYQMLMVIYAGSGMKTKALNVFKECENIFKQELDIDPDNETLKIYNQIKQNKKLSVG